MSLLESSGQEVACWPLRERQQQVLMLALGLNSNEGRGVRSSLTHVMISNIGQYRRLALLRIDQHEPTLSLFVVYMSSVYRPVKQLAEKGLLSCWKSVVD